MMSETRPCKIPESVLVVIYTPQLDVLLIERADHPGSWQSVTGSRDALDEPLRETARREVLEETGIVATPGNLRDWGADQCVRHLPDLAPPLRAWRHAQHRACLGLVFASGLRCHAQPA